jgi:ribosome-binding ATPase YchF (GTP1/OBG family)
MRLGIIGLPQSGKSTVFEALTKSISDTTHKNEDRIGTIRVPDRRVDVLSKIYNPQKTIYAQVEYFLPGTSGAKKEHSREQSIWSATRDCDALIHVIRNHSSAGFEEKSPYEDFVKLEQELILADLVVVEKRLERIELDQKRGKKMDSQEHSLLKQCRQKLEDETPLRRDPDLASARQLRGFAFLSVKPMLVLFNNDDEDEGMPEVKNLTNLENCLVVRGKLEQELAQMSAEDAAEFLNEFNISESAMDRVIRSSYNLLGLISFFTIGKDEIRAWTIRRESGSLGYEKRLYSRRSSGL